MPRQRKPSWVVPGKGRPGRFRTFIDGKARYFPPEIGKDDRPQIAGIPKAAWEYLARLEREGKEATRTGADPTVYRLATAYLLWASGERDAGRISPEHYDGLVWRLRVFTGHPGIADTKAMEVTADQVAAFFGTIEGRYSRHYLAAIGRTVGAAFRWGAKLVAGREPARLLPQNPLAGYDFPRAPGAVRGYVEGAIVRRFLRWAWARARKLPAGDSSRRFDRLFLLMLRFQRLTGCRPGEACGLLWQDIDWDEKKIVIPADRQKTGRKTGKVRTIYLTPPVQRLLRAILGLEGRHESAVFTHMRRRGGKASDAERKAGDPWSSATVAGAKLRAMRAEAIAAGLEGLEAVGPKKLVAYINRHGFVSDAVGLGYSHEEVAHLAGNSAAVVASTYSHSIDRRVSAMADDISRRRRKKP